MCLLVEELILRVVGCRLVEGFFGVTLGGLIRLHILDIVLDDVKCWHAFDAEQTHPVILAILIFI